MNKLNDLNKNINTSYNNFIVEELENVTGFDKWIIDFSKQLKFTNDFYIKAVFWLHLIKHDCYY